MSSSLTTPTTELDKLTTWPGVAAGLFVFVVAAGYLLAAEIPTPYGAKAPPALFTLAFWSLLLIPAAGFCLGWVLNFPRWSYPYSGLAAAMALYLANAATPGLTFLGYPVFGRQVWGARALLPLLLAAAIGWTATRSFAPLGRFFAQMKMDLTLPTYMMMGLLPLFVFIAFDEIENAYAFRYQVIASLIMLVMVVLYLRSRSQRQRSLSLAAGAIAVIAITSISSGVYWYRLGPDNIHLPGFIGMTLCTIAFLLWPFLTIGLARALRRGVDTRPA